MFGGPMLHYCTYKILKVIRKRSVNSLSLAFLTLERHNSYFKSASGPYLLSGTCRDHLYPCISTILDRTLGKRGRSPGGYLLFPWSESVPRDEYAHHIWNWCFGTTLDNGQWLTSSNQYLFQFDTSGTRTDASFNFYLSFGGSFEGDPKLTSTACFEANLAYSWG